MRSACGRRWFYVLIRGVSISRDGARDSVTSKTFSTARIFHTFINHFQDGSNRKYMKEDSSKISTELRFAPVEMQHAIPTPFVTLVKTGGPGTVGRHHILHQLDPMLVVDRSLFGKLPP